MADRLRDLGFPDSWINEGPHSTRRRQGTQKQSVTKTIVL